LSRSASPFASAAGSARSTVSAVRLGSFQCAIGSITICLSPGIELSHCRSALLVGMSPRRMISSGARAAGRSRAIMS
jgi:hypothetical protein